MNPKNKLSNWFFNNIYPREIPVKISPIIATSETCEAAYNGKGNYTIYFKGENRKASIQFDGKNTIEKYREDLIKEAVK